MRFSELSNLSDCVAVRLFNGITELLFREGFI